MMSIQEFDLKPIFCDSDYLDQAQELRQKLVADIKSLPKSAKTDEDKWEYRNMYINIYKYFFLLVSDALMQVTILTLTDNLELEKNGWFIYPRKYRISLGKSSDYKTIDEYNSAIYTKYFNAFFAFELSNSLISGCFEEAKLAYKRKCFYSCACSLLPIIEQYNRKLSEYDGSSRYNNHVALDSIAEKILGRTWVQDSALKQLSEEYKRITEFMNKNYYKSSKQNEKEPDVLCRNRLLHGILTREVSDSDCLKLFHIIRAQAYLDRFNLWCEKLLEFHGLALQTEDRIFYGENEYEKLRQIIDEYSLGENK